MLRHKFVPRLLCGARSLSLTPCGHPIVDVAKLKEGCSVTTDGLRTALFDHGYFYAANVEELSAEYIRSIYSYAERCHALPTEVKYKYRQRGGTGIYSGPDIGQLELQYEADGVAARVCGWDYSRARFSLGDGVTEGDARYPSADELSPPFASVLDDCYSRQDDLARVLLGAFERALELPARSLLDMFDGEGGDFGTIRLLHYPGDADGDGVKAAAVAKDSTGIGAHTDFECFTLMHQTAHGLQLLPPRRPARLDRSAAVHGGGEVAAPGSGVGGGGDGGGTHKPREDVHAEWVDAPVRPAEFVVILGDMLERLTNGALLATPHRVLPTRHTRNSIIRFNAFAPGTLIAPLRPFVTEERPAAYSAVRMRTHMETTMKNLEAGLGSWDTERRRSRSATFDYGGERVVLEVPVTT